MNNITKFRISALVLSGLLFGLVGCVGYVEGRGHYSSGPWYHEGPWMDGPGWVGRRGPEVGIDIHPPGFRR